MLKTRASMSALAIALAAAGTTTAQAQSTPGTISAGSDAQTAPVDGPESATPTTEPHADDIVVVGTRRTDRTLADSPSPVDVISSAELQAQPTANVIDSLKNIIPSFFVGQNTISDASSFVRSPSLRGLPGDEILVMLNGKRYNRSALVQVYTGGDTGLSFGAQAPDISAIPSIAISNLQVLRDGATAQYGSDAIGGVLNFGLRKDAGIELQARYGQFYDGDGDARQIAGDVGFKVTERGFINVAGEYNDDLGTSRGRQPAGAAYFAQANPALAAQIPNYPGTAQIWGSSPTMPTTERLRHRLAVPDDVDALDALMHAAIEHLQRGFLSPEQVRASRRVMGLDTQLIRDGTYFVVESGDTIVGCGGWSYRATLFGGDDSMRAREPEPLDPRVDAARIRAMYTRPGHARRGIGRLILGLCERAAKAAGFTRAEMATLAGEPLYRACGYAPVEPFLSDAIDGVRVPMVQMAKSL